MTFGDRLAGVRRRIEAAGGDPGRVEIVAVTKGRPVADCAAAHAAGLALGENRVQEALSKMAELPGARWHLVGTLQANKARPVAGRFELVQSIDSDRVAAELARRSEGRQAVLVQVNVAREPQKHGFDPDAAVEAAVRVASILDVRGLMGMAAATGDPEPAFRELARLRAEAEQRLGRPLPVLSMGMSGDFEAAVRAGSTMLRLGRSLFA